MLYVSMNLEVPGRGWASMGEQPIIVADLRHSQWQNRLYL